MYEHASASFEIIARKNYRHDISSLMKETVYRAGHNHGLMADVALLQATRMSEYCSKIIDVPSVQERAKKTLSAMFFSSGLTKEHSLSYQLWNLNYAMEFFRESSTENYDEEECRSRFPNILKGIY